MSKFMLIETKCRKCGKPLMTGNRSLYGRDEAKKRLDRICSECVTGSEKAEIESFRPSYNERGNHGNKGRS